MRPTGQGLFLQSFCIPTIHGGQMSEGTTPGKEEVELRQEQQPRVTQEQLPRGTTHFSNTEVFEKWSKAKTAGFALHPRLRKRHIPVPLLRADNSAWSRLGAV